MKTLRTLETVAWFALYGAIIVFLLTWNTASPAYNAVYVERTATEWPADVGGE
jgi:hypothetical protein